jgi:hypothetical protein
MMWEYNVWWLPDVTAEQVPILDRFGEEDWELVAVAQVAGYGLVAYFKREVKKG